VTGPGHWAVAAPADAELGERPFWDPAAGALMWVDILAGQLHAYRPGAGDAVVHTAGVTVGAAAPRAAGGYVLAAADGFRLTGPDGRPGGGPLRPPGLAAGLRFNDGACDPAGRFWAGTVAADRRPGAGALYRLEPGGQITVALDGVTESNGLGWSLDGGTFYYIDSGEPRPRIRAFPCDLASGALGRPRDLVVTPPGAGIPDGLTVDAEGALWVAFWGGHAVRRYSPAGELLAELPVPVSQPSCPAFGGPDLGDLYLTTAWENMTGAQRAAEPLAGHLLRTRVAGVTGQPVAPFAG
jgi:sugar lactone lactonase YvrE